MQVCLTRRPPRRSAITDMHVYVEFREGDRCAMEIETLSGTVGKTLGCSRFSEEIQKGHRHTQACN
jgi:hypothetical protein